VTRALSYLHRQFPSLRFPTHPTKMSRSSHTHRQQWSKVHSLLHNPLKNENTVAQPLIPPQSRVETTRTACQTIQLKFHSIRGSTCSSSRTRKNIIITSSKLSSFNSLLTQFLRSIRDPQPAFQQRLGPRPFKTRPEQQTYDSGVERDEPRNQQAGIPVVEDDDNDPEVNKQTST
jgi:hypothetical protein